MPYLADMGFQRQNSGLRYPRFRLLTVLVSLSWGRSVIEVTPVSFLTLGLVLTAIVNLLMGFIPALTSSVTIMFIMLFLNGWFQGMGWPPSGRVLVHWFSVSERGSKTAIWNVAHNVGGGLMAPITLFGIYLTGSLSFGYLQGFEGAFIYPALLAIVIAIASYVLVRDTPQSVGLPSIEAYRDDYPTQKKRHSKQN